MIYNINEGDANEKKVHPFQLGLQSYICEPDVFVIYFHKMAMHHC